MSEQEPFWSRRHKRRARRFAYDVRLVAPLLALALCIAGSATAILAVERAAPTSAQSRVDSERVASVSQDASVRATIDACRTAGEEGR